MSQLSLLSSVRLLLWWWFIGINKTTKLHSWNVCKFWIDLLSSSHTLVTEQFFRSVILCRYEMFYPYTLIPVWKWKCLICWCKTQHISMDYTVIFIVLLKYGVNLHQSYWSLNCCWEGCICEQQRQFFIQPTLSPDSAFRYYIASWISKNGNIDYSA